MVNKSVAANISPRFVRHAAGPAVRPRKGFVVKGERQARASTLNSEKRLRTEWREGGWPDLLCAPLK